MSKTKKTGERLIPKRVLQYVVKQPWAILPDALETIYSICCRDNLTPEMVASQLGRPLDNSFTTEIRDGVAIIPIHGAIFSRANLFNEISGGVSTDQLAIDFSEAIENPEITAILFDIDSPGGETTGVSEFAEMIFKARGKKKIHAFVSGVGASAAYWIGSAADEFIIADTARVGSIGTVIAFEDDSEKLKGEGIEEIRIVSSNSPRKNLDPRTSEGKSDIVLMLDKLTQVFIDAVAKHRGVTAEVVLSDFGKGGVLVGSDAVDVGMADSVSTFEDVIIRLTGKNSERRMFDMSNEVLQNNDPNNKGVKTKPTNSEVSESQIEAIIAKSNSAMSEESIRATFPTIISSIEAKATMSEINRVKAIEACSVPGYAKLLNAAKIDPTITAEKFAMDVLKEQKETQANRVKSLEDDAKEAGDVKPEEKEVGDEEGQDKKDPENKVNKGALSNILKGANNRQRVPVKA